VKQFIRLERERRAVLRRGLLEASLERRGRGAESFKRERKREAGAERKRREC